MGKLVRARRPVLNAHGRHPQRAVADLGCDVDSNAGSFENASVLVQTRPVECDRIVADAREVVRVQLAALREIQGKGREGAVTHHFGGDALKDLARARTVEQQAHVRVGVYVDEAGAPGLAGAVQAAGGYRVRWNDAQRGNTTVPNADIAWLARSAAAIQEERPTHQEVESGHSGSRFAAMKSSRNSTNRFSTSRSTASPTSREPRRGSPSAPLAVNSSMRRPASTNAPAPAPPPASIVWRYGGACFAPAASASTRTRSGAAARATEDSISQACA